MITMQIMPTSYRRCLVVAFMTDLICIALLVTIVFHDSSIVRFFSGFGLFLFGMVLSEAIRRTRRAGLTPQALAVDC